MYTNNFFFFFFFLIFRLSHMDSEDMISLSSPESERSEGGSLLAQIYKELSITSV